MPIVITPERPDSADAVALIAELDDVLTATLSGREPSRSERPSA